MAPRFGTLLRILCTLLALLAIANGVCAQIPGGPPENVRMRLGPLFLDPGLSLTNAGVDDNVFNDSKSASPKSDATVTATPKTDFWVRFGPSWLSGRIREDLVYYQENASERSANNTYNLSWTIPLNRITLRPETTYTSTRERPGFEIDTRAARTELDYAGRAEIKWFSKSSVVLKAARHEVSFDQGAKFENIYLRDALNRAVTTVGVSLDYHLTPLTTIALDYTRGRDRFSYDTLRDSDSTMVAGSVRFDPAALVKGNASVGYQDYKPNDPQTPGYKGLTAVATLSYVLLGSTKLNVNVSRSVQYSYDINQPYYIQTGGSLGVAQQLFGPVDVILQGGLHQLAYQNRVGAMIAYPDRTDHVLDYGGGVGYHLGRDTRLGFNIERDTRTSILTTHEYTALRYGFSVTYGGN